MSDNLMVCPYDSSHVVTKLRMANHLVKCQENHPDVNLAICFFDFLHRVPREKLKEHLKDCPTNSKYKARFCFEEPTGPLDPDIIYLTRSPWKSTKREEGASATESSFSSDFAMKCSLEDSKGHKGKAKGKGKSAEGKTKKSANPKEESWDSPSSEDSDEE